MIGKDLEELQKQIKNISKKNDELKKLNKAQARIINKISNKEFLRKYIEEDKIISKIVEILEFCVFKAHRKTLRDFLKEEYKLETDNMKGYELEAAAINLYKFEHTSLNTVDKKLEELKVLKLVDFNDDNYYIKATDLLITVRKKEYGRINNSIKDEKDLIIDTKDKLFAYRFTFKNNYLTKNKELIHQFKVLNSIYAINQNVFVIGRRGREDLPALKRRVRKLINSDLVDTTSKIDRNDNRYKELLELNNENVFNLLEEHERDVQIPIILYISKEMKVNLNDIVSLMGANPIHIIRY